jgi:hypothetical protein
MLLKAILNTWMKITFKKPNRDKILHVCVLFGRYPVRISARNRAVMTDIFRVSIEIGHERFFIRPFLVIVNNVI